MSRQPKDRIDAIRWREAAIEMKQAIETITPENLELLADWFDVEQKKRDDWESTEVQASLRLMAKRYRAAMVTWPDTTRGQR